MMAQFIVYSLAVAASFGAAGYACEHIRALRGVARRLLWVLVMSASIIVPLVAVRVAPPDRTVPVQAVPAAAQVTWSESGPVRPADAPRVAPVAAVPSGDSGGNGGEVLAPAPAMHAQRDAGQTWAWPFGDVPDAYVLRAWMALTVLVWAYLIAATWMLRRRTATWTRAQVDGEELYVSPDAGPALIGVLRPRIVVPRWFFDEPAASQALILAHERLHRRAGDPLLMRAALLAVALVPWNLPLWWQLRRLRTAIELDCDARVTRAGNSPGAYGEVLLRVAQRTTLSPVGAISMGLPASALELRILNLAEAPVRRAAAVRALGAMLFAIAGTALAITLDAPALVGRTVPQDALQAPMPDAMREQGEAASAAPLQPDIGPGIVVAEPAEAPPATSMAAAAAPMTEAVTAALDTEGATEVAFAALLRTHPELLAGQSGNGWYAGALVLRPDGSVFRSALRYADDRSRAYRDLLDLRYLPAVSLDPRNSVQPVAGSQTAIQLRRAGDLAPDGRVLSNDLIFLYGVLPAGYDEQRSLLPVWEGVLARHSELLLPREAAFANRVTVVMDEDGRIARELVEVGTREDILRRAPDFTQLGVREEDIGVRGTTTLTRNDYADVEGAPLDQQMLRAALWSALGVRDELIVHYAWPRRRGEPAGGWPPAGPSTSYGERALPPVDGRRVR